MSYLARAVGVVVCAVIAVGYAAGCTPDRTSVPAPTVTDRATVRTAVNRLCWAFANYRVDDLARPTVEGDIEYLAGLQGVPASLRRAALNYWDDPRVRNLKDLQDWSVAAERQRAVVAACENQGWDGAKAPDQPPAK